ncbi:MAG: hypothetical protein PHN56_05705 [Candidatus Nanoarchaeia archaeon]|nr:hypothetical protein [Candidatus Nanoarchaeia archaeon]
MASEVLYEGTIYCDFYSLDSKIKFESLEDSFNGSGKDAGGEFFINGEQKGEDIIFLKYYPNNKGTGHTTYNNVEPIKKSEVYRFIGKKAKNYIYGIWHTTGIFYKNHSMGNFYLKDSNEKEMIKVNMEPANFKNVGIKKNEVFYEYCPGELNLLWHLNSYKFNEELMEENFIPYADFFLFKKNLATLDNNPVSNLKKISNEELLDVIFKRKINVKKFSLGDYFCKFGNNTFFVLNEKEFASIK